MVVDFQWHGKLLMGDVRFYDDYSAGFFNNWGILSYGTRAFFSVPIFSDDNVLLWQLTNSRLVSWTPRQNNSLTNNPTWTLYAKGSSESADCKTDLHLLHHSESWRLSPTWWWMIQYLTVHSSDDSITSALVWRQKEAVYILYEALNIDTCAGVSILYIRACA